MTKLGIAGLVIGSVLFVVTVFVFRVAYGALIVFMFIWNVTDIQNVGVNGWNVTWLVLATIMALGLIASFFQRSK